MKRKGYFVTLGFNESKALKAVAEAQREKADVILIVRKEGIKAAQKAVERVKELGRMLEVDVTTYEVDPADWSEPVALAQKMREYWRIHVTIGGGLRIPQAYTILATLDVWDRIEALEVHDYDTGDEVTIPKWLIPILTSPERKGKIKVLKALEEEPKTKQQISAETGLSHQTVSKYLSFLTKAKLAKRVIPNKYKLTSTGQKLKALYTNLPS